ncbi:hypothetical protein [Sphingosinicella sp. BN140058]|uniref:hypothetical protein n=1 Tax=Sphingosinicella sp. BN140058 TaxID=1892855 RepID=UPI001011945C|nr:hypothetical protein [Sphingosinicella sp. BN140058]QAY78026.1 hypothetical protein ETR14_16970 [Sphingosinicella sp. BN140058]
MRRSPPGTLYERAPSAADRTTQFSIRSSGMPTSAVRRYEVCGEDADGNIHSFHTDNHDQAVDIAEIMGEDLDCVRILENG